MQNERDTAKQRWDILRRTIRDAFPQCSYETLDEGRQKRHWRMSIRLQEDNLHPQIIVKVCAKVMTHPEVEFKHYFLEAMAEASRIFKTPMPLTEFYGTIFVGAENVRYFEGVPLDDDWF